MVDSARILVADDEPNLRRVLAAILTREGYQVTQAANGVEALELFDADVDVVITDLKMPQVDGMEVLRTVSKSHPAVPVIMITAFGSVDNAVQAVKSGAFDYIEKPFEQEQIRRIVEMAVKQSAANRSAPGALFTPEEDGENGRFGLVGKSPVMQNVFDVIEKVADTPSTVLVTGASGTGKELVAKALHEHSSRREMPFIKINCAAIPGTLMESELFGYEKGAFTGAGTTKPGRFELADGGTLFLDEIGEIPIEMQVKLLRAIQESEFERVGGIKTIGIDVRLITATNRDLEQEVASGAFREDLYYRLNVVPLAIPSLKERQEDIPLLVEHIVDRFRKRLRKDVMGVSADALLVLRRYPWPGNIRELENVLERTILFCSTNQIEVQDLPPEICDAPKPENTSPNTAPGEASVELETSLKDAVRAETSRLERELIAQALDKTSSNVTQAAKLLKISRKSLQMKMKEFGLRDRENSDSSS